MTKNTAKPCRNAPPAGAENPLKPPPARQRRKNVRPLLVALLTAALLAPIFAANGRQNRQDADGASPGDATGKQGDLQSLRSQIETLRREMATAEGSRKDSLDQLKDADRTISATQRELHQLTTQIDALQATLADLEQQSQTLEQRLHAQQEQLAKLLYRQYLRGNPDPLQLFLNGDDAHQVARDLYYMEAVGRARSKLLLGIESSLQQQKALTTASRQQAAQLAAAESKQKEEHASLLAQRAQRQATIDKISEQIAAQRREIGGLQRDEKRLSELVDRLAKIIAAKAAEAREARREAQRQELARQEQLQKERAQKELAQQERLRQEARQETRQAAREQAQQETRQAAREQAQQERARQEARQETRQAAREQARQQPSPPSPPPTPVEEEPKARPPTPAVRREAPPAAPVMGNLATMKGSLRLPARGSVTNRFGTARQEGSTWKGLFIRAGAGSEVRSIAAGRVVFAEWMRGFGNLLIVDHGNDYLSIYANNDSLLKQVGDDVRGGENIATVGNTGGNPESGLYFEIRHDGKPLDPLAWVNAK
ncbi:peptidoglycan DD-metalloendopeptidase family protein [Candidatus Accumulibacter sp. ACC003]|uniref:peptidoglycan DD-metalloendopeptidase family protein n=1 Tax=Candidatus Accumulibacter sp. ACC003 TaxID=2823334 RepID=UPI0025C01180|nr:peptidoglycan DD-metalloendopeptidase family protein [Candidatus Accumulibacter sp. ACC003]